MFELYSDADQGDAWMLDVVQVSQLLATRWENASSFAMFPFSSWNADIGNNALVVAPTISVSPPMGGHAPIYRKPRFLSSPSLLERMVSNQMWEIAVG